MTTLPDTAVTDIDVLTRPFARDSIRQREGGGGRVFDYIPTHTVIYRLNEATNNCWSFTITNKEWRGDLLIVDGALTLPGLGTRAATGVQKVSERGGEDLVKGAGSDCLKKCATLFGVALELYGEDLESGHTTAETHQNGSGRAEAPMTAANTFTCTEPQRKAIYAITRKLEWAPEDAKAEMKERYNKDSSKDLTVAEASHFIDYLKQVEVATFGPQMLNPE